MALSNQQRFFYRNAGWSYNPQTETKRQGRERGARQLAKAETNAAKAGVTFEWVGDECIGCDCSSDTCACCTGEAHASMCCIARDAAGHVIGSLGSICEPSREYRRVVEAEVAMEAEVQ